MVGHFKAIHNQEFHKPAETMWLSVEMWDSFAKENYANIKKGVAIQAVGYIILNKWIDKMNGEERKMYKTRVTKLLTNEERSSMQAIMGDITGDDGSSSGQPIQSDSGFASEAPDIDDQSEFVLGSSDRDTSSSDSHSGKTLSTMAQYKLDSNHQLIYTFPAAAPPSSLLPQVCVSSAGVC